MEVEAKVPMLHRPIFTLDEVDTIFAYAISGTEYTLSPNGEAIFSIQNILDGVKWAAMDFITDSTL
jgi:hypothetical protein